MWYGAPGALSRSMGCSEPSRPAGKPAARTAGRLANRARLGSPRDQASVPTWVSYQFVTGRADPFSTKGLTYLARSLGEVDKSATCCTVADFRVRARPARGTVLAFGIRFRPAEHNPGFPV